MIKLSKKIAVGEQTLSFLELQIVRFEDGNLIASTGQHPTNPEDGASLRLNIKAKRCSVQK